MNMTSEKQATATQAAKDQARTLRKAKKSMVFWAYMFEFSWHHGDKTAQEQARKKLKNLGVTIKKSVGIQ